MCARCRSGARAHKTSETRLIFRARTFCFAKKKKTLDLQVFSRIGKTTKKLQSIPNRTEVYRTDDVKTALSIHGLENISLIARVRASLRCNQSLSDIHDGAFGKNN